MSSEFEPLQRSLLKRFGGPITCFKASDSDSIDEGCYQMKIRMN